MRDDSTLRKLRDGERLFVSGGLSRTKRTYKICVEGGTLSCSCRHGTAGACKHIKETVATNSGSPIINVRGPDQHFLDGLRCLQEGDTILVQGYVDYVGDLYEIRMEAGTASCSCSRGWAAYRCRHIGENIDASCHIRTPEWWDATWSGRLPTVTTLADVVDKRSRETRWLPSENLDVSYFDPEFKPVERKQRALALLYYDEITERILVWKRDYRLSEDGSDRGIIEGKIKGLSEERAQIGVVLGGTSESSLSNHHTHVPNLFSARVGTWCGKILFSCVADVECTWVLEYYVNRRRSTNKHPTCHEFYGRRRMLIDTGCADVSAALKSGHQILLDEGIEKPYIRQPYPYELEQHYDSVKQCKAEARQVTGDERHASRSRFCRPASNTQHKYPEIGLHRPERETGNDTSLTLYIGKAHDLSLRHARHEKKHFIFAAWWKAPLGTKLLLETWNCHEVDETKGAEKWLECCYGMGLFNVAGIVGEEVEPFGRQERWGAQAICYFDSIGSGVYRWSLHPADPVRDLRDVFPAKTITQIKRAKKISHHYVPRRKRIGQTATATATATAAVAVDDAVQFDCSSESEHDSLLLSVPVLESPPK